MNLHRFLRHLLAALGALLVATAVAAATASAASPYGELTRFGEWGKQGEKINKPTEFGRLAGQDEEEDLSSDERNYAIGVDPDEENAVFALDEPVKPKETEVDHDEQVETEHHLRIQKFTFNSTKKAYEATASVSFDITSPQVEEEEDLEAEQFSNIAVDPSRGVLYVLAEEPRAYTHTQDKEAPVATTLYAFKTKESGKELVPATGTEAGGVLVNATKLQAESSEPGKPLIDPRGIAVDPSTGEVIILAHIDEGKNEKDEISNPSDHFVLQRVKDNGELGKRYVDTKRFFQSKARHSDEYPSSPVVTEGKKVLVQFEGITEIPYDFEEATEPKQLYLERENVKAILEPFVSANEAGGALSLSPEGTLYEPVNIRNEELKTPQSIGPGGIAARESGSLTSSTGGLIGWSGGQSPTVKEGDYECVLEPGPLGEPLYVAAGSGGDVFVLGPEYLTENAQEHKEFAAEDKAIIELGPRASGTGGCPAATDSGTIDVSENGIPRTEKEPVVAAGASLELYTTLNQADALTGEWTIKDETTHEKPIVEKPNPLTFNTELVQDEAFDLLQQPNLAHTFTSGGEYRVDVKIHGDDLGTPEELAPKEELKLTVDQAPAVVKAPKSESVAAGATATFTAEASGFPTPTVQWEVSTDKGVKYGNVKGATSDTLTIKPVSASENGYEYRARFENLVAGTIETAITAPATLTVNGTEKEPEKTKEKEPEKLPETKEPPKSETKEPTKEVLPIKETKPAPVPIATVASNSLTVSRKGAVVIKVTCPAGETRCIGTLTLRTLTAVVAAAGAHDAKAKRAILTLAGGSFSVAGGGEQTLTLHLSATARKLLSRSHTLRAKATLAAHDLAGAKHTQEQVVTLRLAKH
jgi:hypothetical protein